MKYFSMLIKPASSLCNLRCRYCFYEDVSNHREIKTHGIMSLDVMKTLIDKTLDLFKEEATITFAFQGGEPTLAGIDYFNNFINYVNVHKKDYHHIQYCIQTNGTLLNEEWAKLFSNNHFLVGISLDGIKIVHDALRIDQNKNGTFDLIMNNIEILKKYNVEYNILSVLTSLLAKYPKELFDFIKINKLDYIQLIPCLPEFDNINGPYNLKPKEFFKFYDKFFDLWYEELRKGHYISVTLIDNMVMLFQGRYPQQCGFVGNCSMQFVVESDGSVYPCDFYVLDQYCLGNIMNDEIIEIYKKGIKSSFIKEPRVLSDRCNSCRYFNICHGQCKRLSVCYYDKNYCGYQELLKKKEFKLVQIARQY